MSTLTRSAVEGAANAAEELAHAVGVGRVPALGCVEQRRGRRELALGHERDAGDQRRGAAAPGRELDDTARVRPADVGRRPSPRRRRTAARTPRAAGPSRGCRRSPRPGSRLAAGGPGSRRRARRPPGAVPWSNRSPATRTPSTPSARGDPGDLRQHRRELVRARRGRGSSGRRASRRCAGAHDRHPLVGLERGERVAAGRRRPPRRRVAQAGNGNRTSSGTGISRLLDDHRARLERCLARARVHGAGGSRTRRARPRPSRAGRRRGTASWR